MSSTRAHRDLSRPLTAALAAALIACGPDAAPRAERVERASPEPAARPSLEAEPSPEPIEAPAADPPRWRLRRALAAPTPFPRMGGVALTSPTSGWVATAEGALLRFDRLRRLPARARQADDLEGYGEAPPSHEARAAVVWRGPALADLVQHGEGLLAVGDAGTLLEIRGEEVRALDAGTSADLRAASSSGEELWIGGARGTLLRGRPGALAPIASPIEGDIEALWGAGPDDVLIGGRGFLARWNGAAVELERRGPREAVWSIDGAGGEVLAAGSDLHRREAGAWQPLDLMLPADLLDVDARSGWAVGERGTLARRGARGWELLQGGAGEAPSFYAVASRGAAAVWATSHGTLGLASRRGWDEAALEPAPYVAAILEGDSVIAVGGDAILTLGPGGARLERAPAALAGVARSSAGTFAVGAGGLVLRYLEGAWRREPVPLRGDLSAIAADGERALAVGASGLALAWDGARFVRRPTGVGAHLRAACLIGPHAYAVGDGGVVLRYDDDGWRREESGTDRDLLTVSAHGDRVLAAGAGGTLLERGPDGWRALDAGTEETITAVHAGSEDWIADRAGALRRRTEAGWEADPLTHAGGWTALARDDDRLVAVGADGAIAERALR